MCPPTGERGGGGKEGEEDSLFVTPSSSFFEGEIPHPWEIQTKRTQNGNFILVPPSLPLLVRSIPLNE